MSIVISKITANQTIDLRHRVLWPNLPREDVILPQDDDGLHFGAFSGSDIVGVGSFFKTAEGFRLRKLAVDPNYQNQGIASALISFVAKELSVEGGTMIWCDARVSALTFYRRNGFEIDRQEFEKRGITYVRARKHI